MPVGSRHYQSAGACGGGCELIPKRQEGCSPRYRQRAPVVVHKVALRVYQKECRARAEAPAQARELC